MGKNQRQGKGRGQKISEPIQDMIIPEYILTGENAPSNPHLPSWPLLVFINTKSGGQLGKELLEPFCSLLSPKQVFELPKEHPSEVLDRILRNLRKLKAEGDDVASHIQSKLRIIVAGGDGTHGWLLGTVADMDGSDIPPIATVPLGTGNNLPFSFGWGKKNPDTDVEAVRRILLQAISAAPISVDRWHVLLRMSIPVDNSPLKADPPISIPSFKHITASSELHEEGRQSYQGGFWNYLSIGMDAEVAYAFHSSRKRHPERFKNQLMNQSKYASLSCTQGWFCASCFHPKTKNINKLAEIFISKLDGSWQKLDISHSIRAIVLLNLPSYSGGLNPWGTPNDKKSLQRGLTAPFVNDGLLEVVGFRDGWHGATLVLPFANTHGTRLAQAHKVKIQFLEHTVANHTYVRVDGEPWMQPIPKNSSVRTEIEITHKGQAVALALTNCVAKSVKISLAPGQEC